MLLLSLIAICQIKLFIDNADFKNDDSVRPSIGKFKLCAFGLNLIIVIE